MNPKGDLDPDGKHKGRSDNTEEPMLLLSCKVERYPLPHAIKIYLPH
jgi:hypothetical protein